MYIKLIYFSNISTIKNKNCMAKKIWKIILYIFIIERKTLIITYYIK